MAKLPKTTEEQREKIYRLLIKGEDKEAEAIVRFLGFSDGIIATFFEYCIKLDGLNYVVITAIATHYKNEIQREKDKATTKGVTQ